MAGAGAKLGVAVLLSAVLVICGGAGSAVGAPDDFDPAFGDGGLVSTPLGKRSEDAPRTVVATADGGAIVVGTRLRENGGKGIYVMKFTPDGSLDHGFGEGGKVLDPFISAKRESAAAALVQPDGKIVIAGYTIPAGSSDAAHLVARLHPNGQLDRSFGTEGITLVKYEPSTTSDQAKDLALAPDGSIVVAGSTGGYLVVFRLTPGGALDDSFSDDGLVYDGSLTYDVFDNVDVAAGGAVVLGGDSNGNGPWLLRRYDGAGELDPSFSDDGLLRITPGRYGGRLEDLVALPGGGLLIAGSADADENYNGARFTVARLASNGDFDPSFGTGGLSSHSFGDYSLATALVPAGDGRIVAAGWSKVVGRPPETIAVRLSETGVRDDHFGEAGVARIPFRSAWWGPHLSRGPDGEVWLSSQVEAGRLDSQEIYYESATARLRPGGGLDTAFSSDGWDVRGVRPLSNAAMRDVFAQPSRSRFIGVGEAFMSADGGYDAALVAYGPGGGIDASFGVQGRATVDIAGDHDRAFAGAVLPDGGFAVAGEAVVGYSDGEEIRDAFVARFAEGGLLRREFGNGGIVRLDLGTAEDRVADMRVDGRGRLVLAARTPGSFTALRLDATTGKLDRTFGGDGIATHDFDDSWWTGRSHDHEESVAVVIDSDGSVLLGGHAGGGGRQGDLAVVKLSDDGRLVPAFGIRGTTMAGTGFEEYGSDLALTPGGKILALGFIGRSQVLARFREDGVPDPAFGSGGVVEAPGRYGSEMQVLSDGHVTTAGTFVWGAGAVTTRASMSISHVDDSGSAAPDFGDNGLRFVSPTGQDDGAAIAVRGDGRILVGGTFDRHFGLARLLGDSPPFLVPPGPPPPPPGRPGAGPAPQTRIVSGPPRRTARRRPVFRFASSIRNSGFQCRIDRRAYAKCRSPRRLSRLAPGRHVFSVRAVAPSGRKDLTPARRRFSILRSVRRPVPSG